MADRLGLIAAGNLGRMADEFATAPASHWLTAGHTDPEVDAMTRAERLSDVFATPAPGAVPGARAVTDLPAALDVVRRLGGAIVSEIRTAPGIASWAFIADRDGSELVLWQSAQ